MGEVERLLDLFASGALVRPTAEAPNFVDLVWALFGLAGGGSAQAPPGADGMARLIGPADHHVLVLVDGLGAELLGRLPPASFLRRHRLAEFRAVFPSTTAAALVSLATGRWPGQHGVPGWWVRLEEFGLTATVLPFVERFSERPLEQLGVPVGEVFPVASIWPQAGRDLLAVTPAQYVWSTFSRYSRGDTPGAGYREIPEGMQIVRRHVAQAERPTFTSLYLPQLDALVHKKGTEVPEVVQLLAGLDENCAALAADLGGRARIVVTADHGLVNTSPERTFILEQDDPLMDCLLCPPSGEPTVPLFHVVGGQEARFADLFARRFGEAFVLVTPDEAEELRLFGPGKLLPVFRRRLGTLVGIAPRPAALYFRPRQGSFHLHVGVHAGLSEQEMTIPLVVA